jgi:hypothetical protein
MRSFAPFAKGLFAIVLGAAGLGLAGCGPNYAIYAVHVTSATPRNDIAVCRMSIADEAGTPVLAEFPLQKVFGTDSSGALTVKQGCQGGLTPANVGTFSYSTSRSSGSLTFTVNAYLDDETTVVQTAKSQPQEIHAYPPEIKVELGMTRVIP